MKKQENDIGDLRTKVSQMGNLAERMVSQIVDAIQGTDQDTVFQKVSVEEEQLDQMQLDIDKEAVRLLTVYSPVASDLRFVLSVTRVCAELERIGDQTKNICESLQLLLNNANTQPIQSIHRMAGIVSDMVRNAMDAFVQNDGRKARTTIACDDVVDAIDDQVIEELLRDEVERRGSKEPVDLAETMAQILVSRSLERIGDHATNICEDVVYMVKGDDIRHQD